MEIPEHSFQEEIELLLLNMIYREYDDNFI